MGELIRTSKGRCHCCWPRLWTWREGMGSDWICSIQDARKEICRVPWHNGIRPRVYYWRKAICFEHSKAIYWNLGTGRKRCSHSRSWSKNWTCWWFRHRRSRCWSRCGYISWNCGKDWKLRLEERWYWQDLLHETHYRWRLCPRRRARQYWKQV